MDITLGTAVMRYKSLLDIVWQYAGIHIHKVQDRDEALRQCLFD